MEVSSGFKQTDVGIIPNDWDVARIVEVASITTGSRNTQDRIADGAFPFFVRSQTVERINSYSFDGEAVLTAGDGVGTGKVFHYINGKFDFHQRVYKISNFSARLIGYYFYLYFSDRFFDRIMSMTAKSSVDSVRREMIADVLLPLPPPTEQSPIAEALSDADALMASLDALIAKKRDLKQAAMQQLLTGDIRLPGFSGNWKITRLGELATIVGGGTPKSNVAEFWDGGILWCTPTDITATQGKYLSQTERTISEEGLKKSAATLLPAGTLLLCTRATLGEIKIATIPICTNQGFKSLICRAGVSNEFLYYKILTMKQALIEKSSGSTFLEVSKRAVVSLEVDVPTDLAEQSAIATVLSDMDSDLAALETKRNKARVLKLGMMQELLTGRIRLL